MWHGEIQTTLLRHEQRCAGARSRREVGDAGEPIRIPVLEYVDKAVAAADVNSLARGVVEQVVRVPDDVDRSDLLAAGSVEDQHFGGRLTADEQQIAILLRFSREDFSNQIWKLPIQPSEQQADVGGLRPSSSVASVRIGAAARQRRCCDQGK